MLLSALGNSVAPAVIPSSGNQGGSSVAPAAEVSNARDSR
ncbi:hypothetical protein Tco_0430710, partial [Tanacetum coccineum]